MNDSFGMTVVDLSSYCRVCKRSLGFQTAGMVGESLGEVVCGGVGWCCKGEEALFFGAMKYNILSS